jgi:hypothetical protein
MSSSASKGMAWCVWWRWRQAATAAAVLAAAVVATIAAVAGCGVRCGFKYPPTTEDSEDRLR